MSSRIIFSLLVSFMFTIKLSGQNLDFTKIKTPVIFLGNEKFAYRDPAVVYHNDQFYLYFTLVERTGDSSMYLFTAFSISRDLVHWTYPEIITPRDRNLNFSSPGNIIRFDNQWIMCLQTYPTPNNETWGNASSRIWISRSHDLTQWSKPELLQVKGNHVPIAEMGRMIDPYLLEDQSEPGKWWCYYKQNGVSMSYSYDLQNWTFAGTAESGENVTVLYENGEYILFHSPKNGIGIKKSRSPNVWGEDINHIVLGQENWKWAERRITAATVINLTGKMGIGKYIMFFHGASEEGASPFYNAHNNASMGFAWSQDLLNWDWPGK